VPEARSVAGQRVPAGWAVAVQLALAKIARSAADLGQVLAVVQLDRRWVNCQMEQWMRVAQAA